MLSDLEPIRPTRGYRVHSHNGRLIDLQAEGMWPLGAQLDFHRHHASSTDLPRVVVTALTSTLLGDQFASLLRTVR